MITEKRLYSMNIMAYVMSKKPNVTVHSAKNEDGVVYFVVEEDISELIKEYKQNEELNDFVDAYRKVRGIIRNTQ